MKLISDIIIVKNAVSGSITKSTLLKIDDQFKLSINVSPLNKTLEAGINVVIQENRLKIAQIFNFQFSFAKIEKIAPKSSNASDIK